jgi:hypothetical protein
VLRPRTDATLRPRQSAAWVAVGDGDGSTVGVGVGDAGGGFPPLPVGVGSGLLSPPPPLLGSGDEDGIPLSIGITEVIPEGLAETPGEALTVRLAEGDGEPDDAEGLELSGGLVDGAGV